MDSDKIIDIHEIVELRDGKPFIVMLIEPHREAVKPWSAVEASSRLKIAMAKHAASKSENITNPKGDIFLCSVCGDCASVADIAADLFMKHSFDGLWEAKLEEALTAFVLSHKHEDEP